MRYTTIIDFRELPSWQNPNARQLYLYLTLARSYQTTTLCAKDTVATSLRRLANDVGITLSACRYALESLQLDGLVTVAQSAAQPTAQGTAQNATQRTARTATHFTTHIRVLSANELQGGYDTRSDTPSDTPNGTSYAQPTAQATAQDATHTLNKEITELKENLNHTHTSEDELYFLLEEKLEEISQAVGRSSQETGELLQMFIKTCSVTQTKHKGFEDIARHCVSWINKQPKKRAAREPKKSDTQIRQEQQQLNEERAAESLTLYEHKVKQLMAKIPTPTNQSLRDFCEMLVKANEQGSIEKAKKFFGPPAWQFLEDSAKSIRMSVSTLLEMVP